MNKAILMGRLTADPEMRQTPNGVSVARFTIAVNRRFAKEGQQTADFISCVAWRQQAEFLCRYFHKGNMIAVVGSIQTRSWDGSDGKRNYATEVVADEVYFTGEKTSGGGQHQQSQDFGGNYGGNSFGNAGGFNQSAPAPQTNSFPGNAGSTDFGGFDTNGFSTIDGSEDDLPF